MDTGSKMVLYQNMTSLREMQPPLVDRLDNIRSLLERLGPVVVGDRLRRIRMRQHLSIRELAAAAGMSKTSVVRLEAGQSVRPATVLRACDALSLHVERLASLSDDEVRPVVIHRRVDDRWLDMADRAGGPLLGLDRPLTLAERQEAVASGVKVPLCLIKSRLSGGRVLPTVIEAYGQSPVRSHPGEEFLYVLSGRARLEVGEEVVELEEGEAVTFWSAEPHRYAPADPSQVPVRLLSVRIDG